MAVCGGRGRCSTCRVRITDGLDGQPPPEAGERATLARIKAPADVRLGCQMRPNHDLSIAPSWPAKPSNPPADDRGGSRRPRAPIAVLFCDLRDFTRMSQQQLPFDTVFLLNRYFETIGEAVESAAG